MAEKIYFTGVEEYNFNTFTMSLGDVFDLEKKGRKPRTVALLKQLWLDDAGIKLAEEHINGTATRFFRVGKKGIPGRKEAEKNFEYTEKNYKSAVKKMASYIKKEGNKNADYSRLTAEIAKGIRLIADSREELLKQQSVGGCIGYDPEVTASLADWVESISYINVNRLENYCLAVVAVLCFFFANGCFYPIFALPESKKSSKRINAVPPREEGFKPQLLCEIESGGKTTTLERAMLEHSTLLLKGDGGDGKTTLLTAIARTVEGKDVVYIPANALNNDPFYPETFILRKMCAVFPQWQDELDYYSENNGFKDSATFDNALVFIDGLDECKELALLLDSAVDLIEKTNICFVFASRYEHPELKKAGVTLFRTCPSKPEKILSGEKKDIFLSLDKEKQNILRKPMYLNIFIENDLSEITYTALLKAKIERDIRKGNADKVLLDNLLADLALWKYRDDPFFKGFSVADIREFMGKTHSYYTADELENELAKIFRIENNNYYIHHLNERDYLISVALAEKLTDVQSVLKEFRDGFDYPDFIRKMLAELLDESLLDTLRRDNMERVDWLSEETAGATDILLNIFKNRNISYTGLNLTRHGITYRVNKKGFAGALINDKTLLPVTLDSAVFQIIPDGETIYAIGRNQVVELDIEFRQVNYTVFATENRVGNHVTAFGHNQQTILFITVKGQAFVYDKATGQAELIMEKDAHSVTAYGRDMFFIGTKDGRIAIVKNGEISHFIQPEKQGEIVIFGKKDDFYLYGVDGRIKAFDGGETTELWNVHQLKVWERSILDDLSCRQVIKADGGDRYVALFYKKGISLLSEVTITEDGIIDGNCRGSLIQIFGYNKKDENEKTKQNLQGSISVDRDKITSICFGIINGVKYLFSAFNSGVVDVREWGNRKGYTGEIRFSPDTFGQSIESIAFYNGQLLVGPSFRALYSLELNLSKSVVSYSVKKQLKGINVGVRRLLKHGNMLYMGCFNGIVALEENDNAFEFRYKINLGGWVWAVCTGREGEIFAAAESTVYSVKEGGEEAVFNLEGKVENLHFECKTNKLYIATEHSVKILDFSQEKLAETEMRLTGGLGGHRPLCFTKDKYENMYIGFAAYENYPADVYFSQGEHLVAVSLPSTYADSAVQGWNRSVQVFGGDDSGMVTDFMLCGGLTDGEDHYSILWKKLHHRYIVSALRLGGHTNYITSSAFYSTEGSKIKTASVGYDGYLNLYEFDTAVMESGVYDKYITPVTRVQISSYNLYDIFVDGGDIYTCDANGVVYRAKNPFGEMRTEVVYTNNDVWGTACRLKNVDEASVISDEMRTTLAALGNTI